MYLIWLLVALAQAGDPSMYGVASTPETTIQATVGESVWLEVDNLSLQDLDHGAVYVFPSGCDVGLRVLQDRRGSVVLWFCAKQRAPNDRGQYDVLLVAPIVGAVADVPELKRLQWAIQTGSAPQPPPGPGPAPAPTPDPTARGSRLVVIRETEDATRAESALYLRLRNEPKLTGRLQIVDKDSQDEAGNPSKLVADCLASYYGVLPAIFVLDDSGKVIHGLPLPSDVSAVTKLLE